MQRVAAPHYEEDEEVVMSLKLVLAGFLAMAACCAWADAQTANPYQIFALAKSHWAAQVYPSKMEYVLAVSVVENGQVKTERYRSGFDAAHGRILVNSVSDYEKEHPYFAPGGIRFTSPFDRFPESNANVDYLGVPLLAPNFGFGLGTVTQTVDPESTTTPSELVREVRAQFRDPAPSRSASPAPSPEPTLRVIAVVSTETRVYDITLVGVESLNGSSAYHLILKPVRDPGRYRLRQLWIDTESYAPLKLVEQLNFVDGPGTTVPWSVTFVQRDGETYIARESALDPMQLHRHRYSQAWIDFEDIRPVERLSLSLWQFTPDYALVMQEP
jgi:hypothetical protein